MSTIQFGTHFMLDGYGGDQDLLSNQTLLSNILSRVCSEMKMHSIAEPTVVEVGEMNQKDPGGFSGFLLIAESHISFHTFPKRGFVTIDVYTCQDVLDTAKLTELFVKEFGLKKYNTQVVPRGVDYPDENIY